ncbi:MAG: DUF4384 domain-containing protein [Acidobacteria bacterium]|nr:DUF4384 domain-containing protein [Acidobacteriota bacterium]
MALSAAWAQSSPEGLTARQLFYDEGKPAEAKPVVQAKQTPARAPTTRPAPPKAEVVAKADLPKKAGTPASPSTPVSRPAQVPMVAVSHAPVAVRYSLVKLENGAEVEVPATHSFRSGDQVRLKVEANQRGYLYLITRGSSGIWKPLFPSREASDNVIEARRGYDVPSSTQAFTFDDQEGREKIFLVFSRVPLSDLDSQIDNLRNRPSSAPSHAEPAAPAKAPVMLAQNLNDRRVEGMREMYSRDLIIETVDAKKPVSVQPASAPAARRKENAVYIASTSRAGDARVVADIELIHGAK